jgi:hypothetical protein
MWDIFIILNIFIEDVNGLAFYNFCHRASLWAWKDLCFIVVFKQIVNYKLHFEFWIWNKGVYLIRTKKYSLLFDFTANYYYIIVLSYTKILFFENMALEISLYTCTWYFRHSKCVANSRQLNPRASSSNFVSLSVKTSTWRKYMCKVYRIYSAKI